MIVALRARTQGLPFADRRSSQVGLISLPDSGHPGSRIFSGREAGTPGAAILCYASDVDPLLRYTAMPACYGCRRILHRETWRAIGRIEARRDRMQTIMHGKRLRADAW